MKLYCLKTYDDLLGLRENFVIASSKEEAIQNCDKYNCELIITEKEKLSS